ncbi:MAG: PilZ domain-containing protein [Acidobacteriota bacterium]|nr:PilZ domain-containing protein [Acidobacteriota bacterium]
MTARPSAGPPGGIERRRAPRAAPDELTEHVSVVGTRLVNISRDGLMIEAPVPLAPNSTLRLRLIVAGVKNQLEARVAQCRPRGAPGGRWGVGVEFTEIPREVRERLTRALRTWRVRPRSA